MKSILAALAALTLASVSTAADEPDNGTPIVQIIAAVAHKTNRKFLMDPRVEAKVQQIEAIVKALDVGTPYEPEKCESPSKRNDS